MTAVEFLKDFMWMKDHHYFLEADLALAFSKAELMEKEQMEITWNNAIDAQLKDKWDSYDDFHKTTFKSK